MCYDCDQPMGSMFDALRGIRRNSYFGDESPFKLKDIPLLPFTSEDFQGLATTKVLEGEIHPPPTAEEISIGEYAFCEVDGDCQDHGTHIENGTATGIDGGEFEYEIRWRRKYAD